MVLVLLMAFGGITWRLYSLQIVENKTWSERSKALTHQRRVIPAFRGAIYDRNGDLLAHDKKLYELWIDAFQMKDLNDIRIRLAKREGVPFSSFNRLSEAELIARYQHQVASVIAQGLEPEDEEKRQAVRLELEEKFRKEKRLEYVLFKGLEEEEYLLWKELLDGSGVVAVSLRPMVKRFYPGGGKLAHVLGFATSELVEEKDPDHPSVTRHKMQQFGRDGVEAFFNADLTGNDGYLWTERDRKGREIPAFRSKTVEPVHGHDVSLTIDMHLQENLESVVDQAYAYHDPKSISAILMDPNSGEILAMANRPSYDRVTMEGVTLNQALCATYEPGSVFKIVAFSAALDKGLTQFGEMHNTSPSNPLLAKMALRDHVPTMVSTSGAFERSSNRVSYLLARKVGGENFLEYVKKFGFGSKTGIELSGEVRGKVHEYKSWDSLTLSRMAMGHAVTVTPIQMLSAVSAIANGGNLMKPTILKEVRNAEGQVLKKSSSEAIRRVIAPKTAERMRHLMEQVVSGEHGTAKGGAIDGVQVAGKTGTTQKVKLHGRGYDDTRHVVSFAGFAPAEKPTLSAIIIVDEPSGQTNGNTGGKIASPIFAQLMKQSLKTLSVAKANTDAIRSNSLAKGSKK